MAMEARGYRENQSTAKINPLEYKRADKTAYAIVIIYSIQIF